MRMCWGASQADERGGSLSGGGHRGSYYQEGPAAPRSAAAYRPHEYSAEHAKLVRLLLLQ
jgi:hypothetical protein